MAADLSRKRRPGSAGAFGTAAPGLGAAAPVDHDSLLQDSAIVDVAGGCVITVRVIPRAKKSAFDGQRDAAGSGADASAGASGKAWLVRLAAPPVDGAANEALIALFAETFGLPKRSIQIISGERAREKRVRVEGVSAAEAAARLRA